jgi:hypothetical protein
MRLRKLTSIGCALAGVCLLLTVLVCGAGAVAVHQQIIAPPNLNVQLGNYRMAGYPVTTGGAPPQQYYSIWLFVTTTGGGARAQPIERGEQIMLVPLRRG